jgi:hypothetical protein
LGEAIDMLKDLEETLYFHAITEAMKGEGAYGDWASENKKNGYHQYDDSRMYYGGWNPPMMNNDGGRSMN